VFADRFTVLSRGYNADEIRCLSVPIEARLR